MRVTATAGAVLLTLSLAACGGGESEPVEPVQAETVETVDVDDVLYLCDIDPNPVTVNGGVISSSEGWSVDYGTTETETLSMFNCTVLEDN